MAVCNYISLTIKGLPSSVNIGMAVYLSISIPITILINSLLIKAFIATKQVWLNTTNFLIVCLSISDIISALIPMVLTAVWFYDPHAEYGCIFENLTLSLAAYLYTCSSTLTILIAVDRYIHMNPDIEKRSKLLKLFDRPNIYVVVVVLLLLTMPGSFLFFVFSNSEQSVIGYLHIGMAAFDVLVLSIVSILYIRAYARIRNFTDDNPVYSSNRSTARPQYVRNLFKSVLQLIVSQLAMTAPATIAHFAMAAVFHLKVSKKRNILYIYKYVCFAVAYSYGIINCCIIFYHNEKAKRWVFQRLSCHKPKRLSFQSEPTATQRDGEHKNVSRETVTIV